MNRQLPVLTFVLGALFALLATTAVQTPPRAASAPQPELSGSSTHAQVPDKVFTDLVKMDRKFSSLIDRYEKGELSESQFIGLLHQIANMKHQMLRDDFPPVFSVGLDEIYGQLHCVDYFLALSELLTTGSLEFPGLSLGRLRGHIVEYLNQGKKCKQRLEKRLHQVAEETPTAIPTPVVTPTEPKPPTPTSTPTSCKPPFDQAVSKQSKACPVPSPAGSPVVNTPVPSGFALVQNPMMVRADLNPSGVLGTRCGTGNHVQIDYQIQVSGPPGAQTVTFSQPGNDSLIPITGPIQPDGSFTAQSPTDTLEGHLNPDGTGTMILKSRQGQCTYTFQVTLMPLHGAAAARAGVSHP